MLIPVGNMQAIEMTHHTGIPGWVKAIFAVSGILLVGLLLLRWRKS